MIEQISKPKTNELPVAKSFPTEKLKIYEREYRNGITYKEIHNVISFSHAIDLIEESIDTSEEILHKSRQLELETLGDNQEDITTPKEQTPFRFLLIDIDGTLIPKIELTEKPEIIGEEIAISFKKASEFFKDSLAIVTNRKEKNNVFPNSPDVVNIARELINETDEDIPLYTGLFKQIPGLSRENTTKRIVEAKIEREDISYEDIAPKWNINVFLPSMAPLIHNIAKRAIEENKNTITLYSIEDLSFVSANRRTCLLYIAKKLKKEYALEAHIVNFVIKY